MSDGSFLKNVARWFDAEAGQAASGEAVAERFSLVRCMPFIFMHLACLGVIWTGWSPVAVGAALLLYFVRMFAITGFYHRYFSHRSFKTNRLWQFVFAVIGASSVQRGPLWWAAHHRHHHRHSDQEGDVHSPVVRSFWWSHMLWFTCEAHFTTEMNRVKDLARYPELRFLNRFDILVPIALACSLWVLGEAMQWLAPTWGVSGMQLVVWGFFISTVVLAHATFTINSLAHRFGKRRFETRDQSRNNFWLALITLGEGWHNNHHRYPGSVRQGFYWWEVDITYMILKMMAFLGIVWDLRPAPARILEEGRRK